MIGEYQALYAALQDAGAEAWARQLPGQLEQAFSVDGHGDLKRWLAAVESIPHLSATKIDLLNTVRIGQPAALTESDRKMLVEALRGLSPWRKGPYQLFGVEIDTEWRSDWKWDRLKDHIEPLHGRKVLDVGCGNGYHCWRMWGAGAQWVVGIDPSLLSVMQFQALRKLHGAAPVYVLPLAIEDVPKDLAIFDTVFSMGVLYHRRSPIDHLLELKGCLRSGGELVLETLVIDGGSGAVLMPEGRYAKMRNVWFIPSCEVLMLWMRRCGFRNIQLRDVTKTSTDEQRSTEWMRFQSLSDFLHPDDEHLTCEGLPAPTRAIITANKP